MRTRVAALAACAVCAVQGVLATEVWGVDMDSMIEKVVPLRTHSIAPPYVDSDLQNRWWDFGQDAVINTNKHIRLTQDRPSQKGWLWSRMPLSLSNWQIDVEFNVDGKAHNLFGDGFAIWLSRDRGALGPVFGSVDYFTGVGIFFDTYANSRHAYQWPRISAMIGDGKTKYDHDHDNEAGEAAACSEVFRRRDVTTKARLTYLKARTLVLELQNKEEGKWTKCFELNTTLPDGSYIGFSAETGDVHDNHDIMSVSTNSVVLTQAHRNDGAQAPMAAGVNGAAKQAASNKKAPKARSGGGGGPAGWFLFILKVIGVGAFVAFAVAAVRTYNAQKKSKRAW